MLWIYFDASALIKRYSQETGTPLINEAFQRLSPRQMTCSLLGVLEIISILVRKETMADSIKYSSNKQWQNSKLNVLIVRSSWPLLKQLIAV